MITTITVWILILTFNVGQPDVTDKHRFYKTLKLCEAQSTLRIAFEEGGNVIIKKPCFPFSAPISAPNKMKYEIRTAYIKSLALPPEATL